MDKFTSILLLTVFVSFSLFGVKTDKDKWQQVADKATNYILNPDELLNTQTYMLYNFLSRKFEMPELGKSIDKENTFKEGSPVYLFRPLFDSQKVEFRRKDIDSLRNSIDKLTLYAIYCNKIALASNYLNSLKEQSEKGGYYLTHALWNCQLLEENNCLSPGQLTELKALKIQLALATAKMLEEKGFFDDIAIEAIAMLYYSNMQSFVKEEWIDKVANQQREDGGWFRTIKNTKTNAKSTVLALWVLQEALHQDAEDVSMMYK